MIIHAGKLQGADAVQMLGGGLDCPLLAHAAALIEVELGCVQQVAMGNVGDHCMGSGQNVS